MLEFKGTDVAVDGLRLSLWQAGQELGYVYLYFLMNETHSQPFCFGEDLMVHPDHRRRGVARLLAEEAVQEARRRGCYKFLGFSRFGRDDQHRRMESYGFEKWGYEFRIELD